MNTAIFTQRMDWNGITLEVYWEPSWLSLPESRPAQLPTRRPCLWKSPRRKASQTGHHKEEP